MRKKLLVVVTILTLASTSAWADTEINSSNFPDEVFLEFVSNYDVNKDGILQDMETASVDIITVRGMNITSLKGIENFTNLKTLRCNKNNLTELDLSSNTLLESLACDNNNISSLNLNNCPNLREVYCTYNGLRTLYVSGCTALEELYCYVNSLDVLYVSQNTKLVSLDCQVNNITALDLTSSPALQFLDCSNNKINSLNFTKNPGLKWLYCHDLNLGTNGLDVSNLEDLSRLWCWNDGLTALDVTSNSKLESLLCSGNSLTTLDLAGNPVLTELTCAGNPIADTVNVNTVLPLVFSGDKTALLAGLTDADYADSTTVKAFDAEGKAIAFVESLKEGENVFAKFAATPSLVRYQCDTGSTQVNMSATYVSDDVKILASCTNGVFKGELDGELMMWKGIPYAKQPVGSLRWKAPQAPDASNELYDAVTYAPTPIQHYSASNPVEIMSPQGEECLALNVWNNGKSDTPKPVMVWIHGGAFNSGGTSNPDYEGRYFAEEHDDVILVSIGYRVGILGFIDFANSGLHGSQNFPDSANLGLLDMLEALRWIKENISAFGGDPENVTVFGQSSGAASIALLMTMPESVGLFQRAITQSGGVSMTSSAADCAQLTQALVQLTSADTMDKLMALSSSDLQAAAEKLSPFTNFPERDGRIIAANPYEAFARNSMNFDFLAGSNADEVNYWSLAVGAEKFAEFIPQGFYGYVQAISQYSSADAALAEQYVSEYLSSDVEATEFDAQLAFLNDLLFRGPTILEANNYYGKNYVYYWEYPSGIPGLGACHAVDIPYVLNLKEALVPHVINRQLAGTVQEMWVNFAKTGDPSTSSITWPEYDQTTQATMIIAETPEVRNANLSRRYELISHLLVYGISGRELMGAVNAESNGTTGDETSTDITPESGDKTLGSSGGGCNSGFIFPLVIAVMVFAAKKRA